MKEDLFRDGHKLLKWKSGGSVQLWGRSLAAAGKHLHVHSHTHLMPAESNSLTDAEKKKPCFVSLFLSLDEVDKRPLLS